MQLTDFDIDAFLRDHWQKKPLFIKNPWKSWRDPIEPDDLAGLACEKDVESRLIRQMGPNGNWELEHGPFLETRFSELGEKNWTLLVQAVDHYVPGVAPLIDQFRFIPNWRVDDIMVSFAADGGGVGPHFDQYDVFLIQGLGQRRWQIGQICDQNTTLLPHDDLRLLADFEPIDQWTCEAGDILYIPPGVAHNGIAVSEQCMTYSVGFRAPSRSELLGYWVDDMLTDMKEDDRYGDPKLERQENPGEISADAIDQLHAMITEKMDDREAFASWFGQYSSMPKYPDMDWRAENPMSDDELLSYLATGQPLYRNPASRFSFVRQGEDMIVLFVDGTCFSCAGESSIFAEAICGQNRLIMKEKLLQSDEVMTMIIQLYRQGSLAVD